MIRFTYKLKLTERVTAKCTKHPRYNPEKQGRGAIVGGCSGCFALFDLYQSRLALEAAANKFQRLAAPWVRVRQPRKQKPTPPGLGTSADQEENAPANRPQAARTAPRVKPRFAPRCGGPSARA